MTDSVVSEPGAASIASSNALSASPAAPIAAAAKSVTAKTEGSSPPLLNVTRVNASSLPCAASQIVSSNCAAMVFGCMMLEIMEKT